MKEKIAGEDELVLGNPNDDVRGGVTRMEFDHHGQTAEVDALG